MRHKTISYLKESFRIKLIVENPVKYHLVIKAQKYLDKVGMALSSVCAVHCALAPVLITIAPLIGLGFLFEERFETIFILCTFGMAFLSLVWGFYKSHRSFEPFYILLLGIALVTISRMDSVTNYLPEPFLMFLAGLSIACSHLINLRLCKHCDTCEHDEH